MAMLLLVNDERIINELFGHVRVNTTLKTVEIYNEYGVQLVLRNLDEETYGAFKSRFQNY